jgi:YbbR domain-containing protein
LENIEYVWVTLDGDELKESKTVDAAYVYMDEDGNQLSYSDITSDYDTVSVTLPVMLKKEVALSVTPVYGSGATAENTIITIEPETIMIYGDPEIVEGINKISLATIDITDFSVSYEYTYPITLDNDVQNLTGLTKATVSIETGGLETSKFDCTNLSFINLPDRYTAEILTESIEVTVRAVENVLSEITSDSLRAVADLSGIASKGDVSVPVKIYVVGFTDAGAIGDYTITINIKE